MLGRRSIGLNRTERLDHRMDAELEGALATAARIAAGRIKALRIVRDDGSASCWHRTWPAWCRDCIRADIAQHGEIYERAIWRLGCCVLCPDHKIPLDDTCRRCMAEARCHFEGSKGLLRLACDACGRVIDPALCPKSGLDDGAVGAFGVCITPSLTRLLGELQSDLQAALAGSPPKWSWGFVQSANDLTASVRHLTLCMILGTRVKCEPRIDLPEPGPGQVFTPVHEPLTPAALTHYAAYGVLAIAAVMLRSIEAGCRPDHRWAPDAIRSLDVSSAVIWLPAGQRRVLRSWAAAWECPKGDALRAAIAEMESVA